MEPAPALSVDDSRDLVRSFVVAALAGLLGLLGSFILLDATGLGRHDVEWFVTATALLLSGVVAVATVSRSTATTAAVCAGLVLAGLVSWVTIAAYVTGGT